MKAFAEGNGVQGFYRRAFADKSQSSIEWHIHESNLAHSLDLLRRHAGVRNATDEQVHAIMFHSLGSVGATAVWLRGNLEATPEQLAA